MKEMTKLNFNEPVVSNVSNVSNMGDFYSVAQQGLGLDDRLDD